MIDLLKRAVEQAAQFPEDKQPRGEE